jgi:hypothetical protein
MRFVPFQSAGKIVIHCFLVKSAIISTTSLKLKAKRKYIQTHWLMIAAG